MDSSPSVAASRLDKIRRHLEGSVRSQLLQTNEVRSTKKLSIAEDIPIGITFDDVLLVPKVSGDF